MSFRKRNVGIGSTASPQEKKAAGTVGLSKLTSLPLPGVRPSPVDGRPVTSTGTASLDELLAGHAGLALGTSLLIEENGTTDYAGVLLRFYAAEGLVQGQHVHVVGLPERWGRELPGLAARARPVGEGRESSEKMKIAWRYETMSRVGDASSTRDRPITSTLIDERDNPRKPFCHSFDLTKRLQHPADSSIDFLQVVPQPGISPFDAVIDKVVALLSKSEADTVHRLVIPALLSPALYPPESGRPELVLQFLHRLRSVISQFQTSLTVLISLPLALYPRNSGLVRWIEILSDGVVELTSFPHSADAEEQKMAGQAEEEPQGIIRLHRLPLFHERYSGTPSIVDDWTFSLSRKRFTIKPYSLPPVEGDTEAQQTPSNEPPGKKSDIEF